MTWRASSGLRAWLIQRCSAVYLLLFMIYCLVVATQADGFAYDQWKSWVASPVNNIAVALFFLALILHAWVGARDIIMDYIKPVGVRLLMLSVLALYLMAMALWAMKVLIVVST